MKLADMKIIVTGGAQGMGAYFATQLAEAGAQVAVGDVLEDKLSEIASTSISGSGKIHARKLDVADDNSIAEFIAWAHESMGGLNGLINNAGILRDGLLVKKDRETGAVKVMSREQWEKVIAVNLTGATFMVRDTVAKMVESEAGPGVIINMSSLARWGNRGQSNYVSAKAALAANTVTWAREFSKFKVRVGAIAPGMIETPMTQGMNPKAREGLINAIPVRRVGTPEDIWQAVRFIIECDYFTGRCLDVDGGLTM